MTTPKPLDLTAFQRWAAGHLVDNRNRGIFAEWLVAQALGAVGPEELRKEWDAVDIRHGDLGVEVKASGFSQAWAQERASKPRFGIAPQRRAWNADTAEVVPYDPRRRTADVYVFCLHTSDPATNANVADPGTWRFWVVPTKTLDESLGAQASLGLSTLNRLVDPVRWEGLRQAVDMCRR